MRYPDRQAEADLDRRAARRLRNLDSLLPDSPGQETGCGATFAVTGTDGLPIATASCVHWEAAAGSIDRTWGAARRFSLMPRIAGPEVGNALDQLLTQWRPHLAGLGEAGHQDTAAAVTWPSHDVTGVNALMHHGLAPRAVIAARSTHRRTPSKDGGPSRSGAEGDHARAASPTGTAVDVAGVTIRRAGLADLDAVVRLGLDLVKYDALFGAMIERPESGQALRDELAPLLTGPAPWAWLAERDGRAVGMLTAEPPHAALWIAPLTRPSPVAYLELMFVEPAERGTGIGAALTQRLHAEVDAAGVPVTLLHYAQVNPLSAPFWSRMGYRPLWTVWEARPALTLR